MKEVENDIDSFNKVEEAIFQFPLPLLFIKNSNIIKTIDDYLPYSIGIEFECYKKNTYIIKEFKTIPDILDVSIDENEQRYRIPNGLKGMVCLYKICEALKRNSKLDLSSSNHYHTDMTDVWMLMINKEANNLAAYDTTFKKSNEEYILNELEKWETAKDKSMSHGWYKFNDLQTLEIRIGEPSFEYSIIIKRLIQCCKITKYLKEQLTLSEEERKVKRLEQELESLKETPKIEEQADLKSIIKQRQINLKNGR